MSFSTPSEPQDPLWVKALQLLGLEGLDMDMADAALIEHATSQAMSRIESSKAPTGTSSKKLVLAAGDYAYARCNFVEALEEASSPSLCPHQVIYLTISRWLLSPPDSPPLDPSSPSPRAIHKGRVWSPADSPLVWKPNEALTETMFKTCVPPETSSQVLARVWDLIEVESEKLTFHHGFDLMDGPVEVINHKVKRLSPLEIGDRTTLLAK